MNAPGWSIAPAGLDYEPPVSRADLACPSCGAAGDGNVCGPCAAMRAELIAAGGGCECGECGLPGESDAIFKAELCEACGADTLRNDPHGAGCPHLCRLCEIEEAVEGDRNGYCAACAAEDAECGK